MSSLVSKTWSALTKLGLANAQCCSRLARIPFSESSLGHLYIKGLLLFGRHCDNVSCHVSLTKQSAMSLNYPRQVVRDFNVNGMRSPTAEASGVSTVVRVHVRVP